MNEIDENTLQLLSSQLIVSKLTMSLQIDIFTLNPSSRNRPLLFGIMINWWVWSLAWESWTMETDAPTSIVVAIFLMSFVVLNNTWKPKSLDPLVVRDVLNDDGWFSIDRLRSIGFRVWAPLVGCPWILRARKADACSESACSYANVPKNKKSYKFS